MPSRPQLGMDARGAVGATVLGKALKRQCYGRANFDLLRLRILLTP
ncbi:hypothetical protein ACFWBB_20130 [Streptomyces sp. NPDC060000]